MLEEGFARHGQTRFLKFRKLQIEKFKKSQTWIYFKGEKKTQKGSEIILHTLNTCE